MDTNIHGLDLLSLCVLLPGPWRYECAASYSRHLASSTTMDRAVKVQAKINTSSFELLLGDKNAQEHLSLAFKFSG